MNETLTDYDFAANQLIKNKKKWLITGVAGFIGSNLLERLLNLGQKVVGIDNFSTGHRKNLLEVQSKVTKEQWSNFHFIEGDIRTKADCDIACDGVNYVLQQAAIGSVPRSIGDPIFTNQNNIDGFLNILVASRDCCVDSFTYASSSSVYGDSEFLPKVEKKNGKPLSPYAVTKVVNELYANVFSDCFKMKVTGLRYFNVFGPRQDPAGPYAAVIPKWIKAIILGEDIIINGDGETSRDFCYVENVIQANILAALRNDHSKLSEVYNIAVGHKTTLNNLHNEIMKIINGHNPSQDVCSRIYYGEFRQGDIRHSIADVSKATRELGYIPVYDIRSGLQETIDWYLKS